MKHIDMENEVMQLKAEVKSSKNKYERLKADVVLVKEDQELNEKQLIDNEKLYHLYHKQKQISHAFQTVKWKAPLKIVTTPTPTPASTHSVITDCWG